MLNSAIAKAERRTLVFGVGIMDAESSRCNGKIIHSYSVWIGMLGRCYRKGKYEREAYSGCTVCDEWLTFSEFNKFYEKYHVEGYELDKDLLVPGNKVYMPSRCVFIPRSLNGFITLRPTQKGKYPTGVCARKNSIKFQAAIREDNKNRHLGLFDDPYDAHLAWYYAKMEAAEKYKDICDKIHPDLYRGLIKKIESLKEENNIISSSRC